jgi:transcription initiation factor TFIIB
MTADTPETERSESAADEQAGHGGLRQRERQRDANRIRDHDQQRERSRASETDSETETDRERGERQVCPECSGALIEDAEHGETVCSECGLVVEADSIDHGPDWRTVDNGERTNNSRVGAPRTKLLHDEGLSSTIDWQNRDAYGRALSARKRRRMQRLRTWDERFRTRDHQERNLKQALGEIDRMGSALGLPDDVRETASVIYRRALEENLLPGRSIEAVATASLYAAARQAGAPRTLEEFATVSRVGEMEFKRAYRYVVRELGLGVQPADPATYVGRFGSELDVSGETEHLARELLRAGQDAGVHVGKSPVGLAAAALYAAGLLTDNRLTQTEVGEVAGVSEVTIRNRYQELLEAYDAVDTDADSGGASAAA